MEPSQQVCSLELAKRLAELGVKQESYFYWVNWSSERHARSGWHIEEGAHRDCESIAAFTVAELGKMLPHSVNVGKQSISYWDIKEKFWHNDGRRIYEMYFDSYLGVPESPQQRSFRETTEADARARMMVFLLENKFVTL
jgi:hypothetical protein